MITVSTGIVFGVTTVLPGTFSELGMSALNFFKVGELTEIPEFGATIELLVNKPLEKKGAVSKNTGSIDYGSTIITMGRDTSDLGQSILKRGVELGINQEHSFCLILPNGEVDYFMGKIFSYKTTPGAANSIVASSVNIEVTSKTITSLMLPPVS